MANPAAVSTSRRTTRHLLASGVIGAVLALTLALMTAPSASASDASPSQLLNYATWSCLHATSYGTVYASSSCDRFDWYAKQWGDGTWQFKSSSSGGCLDDSVYGLRTFYCHPGSSSYSRFQSWYMTSLHNGVALKNQATGRCLDDSNYGARTFVCNNTYFQTWRWTVDYPAPTYP